MNIDKVLLIIQIIVSIALVTTILLQRRGSGLGGAFGGAGGAGYYQKRGAEKVLFNITILLAILFVGFSFLTLVLGR
ncbi:MAG: preprotein translocase subunit SecG [Candidatus Spechtbacteria bacterium RIFCSPLOWO2_01_FULL_46_10]|uniref:Protein-export membrane protein SecG n=1 Tax=Candidatus Spechtbacteria bacterium RIFCSPLOWO2_01_FULL_46_10 TaxID=1802163 RepID=A0A1G2HGS5_9BACT|nr:MAG: preprotein translocase subunit SecG [Candidatus Spechtbacteria bacterium RIFCSPLOWO2_01_FULL_46_10]